MDDLNPITRTERLLDGEDLTPTNREEMFIKRIYDKTQEIPEPVNRKEYFLKKAGEASGDVTVVPLNVTENGTYSEEGKAYSPVTVAVEPPEGSYQLKSMTTPTSLATFEASAMPMPKLKASIVAKQDLHGYDHPWVGGAGKNKLPNPTAETKTVGNLTVSIDSLGIITVSGSTSETTTILFDLPSNFVIPVSVGTGGNGCIYLFNPSVNNNIVLMLYNNDTAVDTWTCSELNRKSSSYTTMGGMAINKIGIRVIGAITISGSFKLSPMITNDGTTDATFAPYSNVCPISGWDNAIVTDTDDVDNPTVTQTTTISLGQTVYGGELDVVNGTSGNKNTHKYIELPRTGWAQEADTPNVFTNYAIKAESPYPLLICSHAIRAGNYNNVINTNNTIALSASRVIWHETSFNTVEELEQYLANNTVQIAYELATPTTFTTQPTPIKSLNGINNLSVDSGEVIEWEYFKALGGE